MKIFALAVICVCCNLFTGMEPECRAQTSLCDPVPQQGTCSFTGINNSCQINVDRAHAISFPTIYMKPGAKLTVVVYNATPLEALTLDLTSFTAALRPDAFQTVFNSLTPNASKATGLATIRALAVNKGIPPLPAPGTSLNDAEKAAEDLIHAQNVTIDETDASLILQQIGLAAQGMTSQSCFVSAATTTDEFPNPWFQTEQWKTTVKNRISAASAGTAKKQNDLHNEADAISGKLGSVEKVIQEWNYYTNPKNPGFATLAPADQQKLDHANQILNALVIQQKKLNAKIATRKDNGNGHNEKDRLNDLSTAIDMIPTFTPNPAGGPQNMMSQFVVEASKGVKTFNVSGLWALNYTNALSSIVTQISQSTYTPQSTQLASSYTQLSPAAKTQALSVTVQSTNKEWVEASAGFVVPWRAYHSYSAAAQASGGSVTNNVVQETLTHTVVPAAFINVNLLEIPNRHGSWALFLSPFVGYNGTTSAVETGIGPTISWRSIELNLMADYGSDTYLSGGFMVGQSLGASNPASPLTMNAYSWRFAPGISIRLPLGGSSTNSGASGATGSSGASPSASGTSATNSKHH